MTLMTHKITWANLNRVISVADG